MLAVQDSPFQKTSLTRFVSPHQKFSSSQYNASVGVKSQKGCNLKRSFEAGFDPCHAERPIQSARPVWLHGMPWRSVETARADAPNVLVYANLFWLCRWSAKFGRLLVRRMNLSRAQMKIGAFFVFIIQEVTTITPARKTSLLLSSLRASRSYTSHAAAAYQFWGGALLPRADL